MKPITPAVKTWLLLGALLAGRPCPLASAKSDSPRRGGTLRLVRPTDWRSLDPAIAFDADAAPIQKLLFRGLLNFGEGIELVADQAADWSVSPEGRIYTFQLRPGACFAHGREVEAEDYIFSFERILDPKTGSPGQTYFLDILGAEQFNRGQAAHVSGLRAPDRRTLVIELKQPRFVFRYVLAMNFANVLPRELVRRYGSDFQYHLIGSGPYCVSEWRRNIRWRFERNPYYSGSDGFVDAVEIMIGGDAMLHAMMLERGELDRALAGPAEAVRFQRDPRLRRFLQRVDTANTDYLFLNTEMKPFDDVRVRRAMNHALDKERYIRLAGSFGTVAHGIVPPAMPWSNPGLPACDHDPAAARALLREAGYPDGFKTELWFILSRPADARIAAGIQQDLREIGVKADLKPVSYAAFEVKVRSRREVPCGLWGWMEDYPDPSNFLDVLLNGDRITDADCNNQAFYNNPNVNARLEQAGASNDPDERLRLFREAESLVMRDAPWVPILHEQIPVLNSPRLRGNRPHPVWLWRFEQMWIDD